MILSYDDIVTELCQPGGLCITPPPADWQLQPASVDLTLGDTFTVMYANGDGTYEAVEEPIPEDGLFVAPGGGLKLASTAEVVTIPHHLVAQVDGKSSLARRGLSIHQTAGWIDPGFTGQVTLELSCTGPERFVLMPGQPIGQIIFMRLQTPTSRPYGDPRAGSHYQGQMGPTPARS